MNPSVRDIETQLQFARMRHEERMHRGLLRAYLAANTDQRSLTFRLRRGTSRTLIAIAGRIKPYPSAQEPPPLWIPKRLSS